MATLTHTHARTHTATSVSLRRCTESLPSFMCRPCKMFFLKAAIHTDLPFGCGGESGSKSPPSPFLPPPLVINRLLCSTRRRWDHCSDRDFCFSFNDSRQQEFRYSWGRVSPRTAGSLWRRRFVQSVAQVKIQTFLRRIKNWHNTNLRNTRVQPG